MEQTAQESDVRVALVGADGSGKTVLLATLGKYFGRQAADGVSLQPLTNETIRYVEENWQALVDGRWPEKSVVDAPVELCWQLSCPGEQPTRCRLHLVDASGEDWRKVFAGQPADASVTPPQTTAIIWSSFETAELVICLVDLVDFVGEPDPAQRLENEIFVSSVLRQAVAGSGRPTALVFTQADMYCQSVLPRFGSWLKLAEHYLPNVYGAYLASRSVRVFKVAAVDRLCIRARDDGRPCRFPAPGFRTAGLDELLQWISKQVDATRTARLAEREKREAAQKEQREQVQGERILYVVFFALTLVALLWWWTRPPVPRPLQVERPALFGTNLVQDLPAQIEFGRFQDEISIRNETGKLIRSASLTLVVESEDDNGRNYLRLPPPRNWRSGETRSWPIENGVARTSRIKVRVESTESTW
jgi:hypothetical protein